MRKIVFVVIIMIMLLGVQPGMLQARAALPAQPADSGNISFRADQAAELMAGVPSQASEDVIAYWTEARMQGAIPMELNVTSSGNPGPVNEMQYGDGTSTMVNSRQYGAAAETAAYTGTYANFGSSVPALTYPFPFNRGYVTLPRTNAVNGKFYFTQYGVDYWCSGTSVTSGGANYSLVLTAGHCVHAGDNQYPGWSYNVVFYPLLGGPVYFGTWSYYQLWTRSSWFTSGNLREDMGFAVMSPNGCGYLSWCVGAAGLAWNQPEHQEYWAFGYPGSPFTGVDLAFCASAFSHNDTLVPAGVGTNTHGIGCDMTGGSSGGAWMLGAKWGNTGGIVNGLNSYKYTSPARPKAMYGPYFASNMGSLWEAARTTYP